MQKNTAQDRTPASRFHQIGTALNRLLLEAPYYPRCSDNKTAALVRPVEYAIRYPYMQVNRSDMVSWLVFDLDHSNSLIWEEVNLPAPNLVITNRDNGHSHLYYAITPVCTSANARSKPIKYMKAIYEAMAEALKADPAYSGPVAKTPGHPWWATWEIHGDEYELGELADYVDLVTKPPWRSAPNLEAISSSRHEILFEQLRFYAYSVVNKERENGSYRSFYCLLRSYADTKNNFKFRGFEMNLTEAQVKATVKSVSRWTWDKYTACGRCHRGVMALDKSLPLNERQRLASKRTHEIRKNSTESKIKAACRFLREKNETPTQVRVARISNITRQTVAKYKHLLEEPAKHNNTHNGEAIQSRDVNYGVNQITARKSFHEVGQKQINFNFSRDENKCLDGSYYDPPD